LKQTQNTTPFDPNAGSARSLRPAAIAFALTLGSFLGACTSVGPTQAPAPIVQANSTGSPTTGSAAVRAAKPATAAAKASEKASEARAAIPAKRTSSPGVDRTSGAAPVAIAAAPVAQAEPAAVMSAPAAANIAAEVEAKKEPSPAPTDASPKASEPPVIPQLSPAEEKDLWERIRRGFSMPELDTPLVADKERSYLSQPAYLQRMMTRGGRYLYFIVEELERRNMPTEIALLPFVESAMNPVAMSSAKASGLWQFIPSTGRAYDLNQNWWVDNRRDVVKSTHAALDYLQKIYAMHGNDWFLALASYNWGEGSVGRAVKSAKAKGLSGDYLSLSMPNETRHYVPKLIALKHIVQRAEQLNIALPAMPNKPYFVTIEKTRPIDLKLAAKFAGMSVEEFVGLNPAHNRPVIAASKNNEIKLPADRAESFLEAVRKHSDDNLVMASWQPYTVKPGETLSSVAQRSGVPEAEIRKANGLRAESKILPGTNLLVPLGKLADEQKVESFVGPRVYEQVNVAGQYHTVGKKETLVSIARRYGLSVASLKAWNGIKKTASRGMNLLVRPAYAQTVLTAESGQRQVVSSTAARTVAAPIQAKAEEAEETTEKAKPVKAVAAAIKPATGKSGKLGRFNDRRERSAAASSKTNPKAGATRAVVLKDAKPTKGGSKSATAVKGKQVSEAKPVSAKSGKTVKTKAEPKVAKDATKKSKKT
jgi:membrane-bound lytic murein transglycosylase D